MSGGITTTNVKHVIQSAVTAIDGWIEEMVNYRLSKCPECAAAGHCVRKLPGEATDVGCGCGVPHIMKVPTRKDSRGRWPQIADKYAWEKFKTTAEYKEYLKTITNDRPRQVSDKHMGSVPSEAANPKESL